jgi:Ca-activated chloride channel family protein
MFEHVTPTLAPDASARDLGGLLGLAGDREVAFPLREVRVRADIAGDCCRTFVEQVFDNPYDEPLEAVHIFPLPPGGAVTEFEMTAGDTVVRGECRERESAERAFDQARQAGRRAALLTSERADVHTIRVTNIPSGTGVRVRLVVVERLDEADAAHTWRFPTVIAPRYVPGAEIGHSGDGAVPDTGDVPDASRLQPPLRLAGGTKLDIEAAIAGPLASVESSLHAVRTAFGGDVVRIAPSGRATLDRDFVVRFSPAVASDTPVRAYSDGHHTLAIINPPTTADATRIARDVVVLVDVSGSMSGEKLDAARRAVSSVVHGLEKGDRFRLIAFESSVHPHTADFLMFDQSSLKKADRWIAGLRDMGGTEMLPALQEAFKGETPAGRLRTVIFITDGQASDEPRLTAFVERHRHGAHLFTIGIDTAVNESLLKQLARVGGGTCELVAPGDDIEEAIVRVEARFGAPVLTDVAPVGLEAARPTPVPLFAGRPVTVLMRGAHTEVAFEGRDAGGQTIRLGTDTVTTVSFPLGALWARERVAWLEDSLASDPARERELKAQILEVALAHHIASRFTAFVAIEECVSTDGTRRTVVQPAELPAGWDEGFRMDQMSSIQACMIPAPGSLFSARHALYSAPPMDSPSLEDESDAEPFDTLARCAEPLYGPPPPRRSFLARLAGTPAPSAASARRDPRQQIESTLATSQDADGSFGGSIERTAAALATLLRLGHTRSRGARRRVVQKCERWLRQHDAHPLARLALDLLDRVEAGGPPPRGDEVVDFLAALPEGDMLKTALQQA